MLMTGRMIKFKWLGSFNVLDPAVPSLPELLTREGYLCGGFCSDFYYNGFWKGFPFRPCIEKKTPLQTDVDLLEGALRFVRDHSDTPLFTWIHLNGPHPPCDGRPPHDVFVREEGLTDELSALLRQSGAGEQASSWGALSRILFGGRPVEPGTTRLLMELFSLLYDGNLLWTDHRVREFIGELDALGVLENTIVAVTSDHGIQLRPDGLSARGPREEGVRVPFILKGPGIPGGPLRIHRRVSTIDFLPTLLELLDIPAPPGLTGRSLVPLFEGEADIEEKPVFSLLTDSIAVWFGGYKYRVTHRGLDALLKPGTNLEGPPLEEESLHRLAPEGRGDDENLAAGRRDILNRGRKILVDYWNALDSSSARGPANQALVGFFKKAGYMK
jgi:hypothetical protein